MVDKQIKVLFISYNGILEPLFYSQVGPYIKELAKKGYKITLLTFEKRLLPGKEERIQHAIFRDRFKRHGITWHWLRYHKKPSLPATLYDIFAGAIYSYYLICRYNIHIIHARSTVPCAMAFIVSRFAKIKFIFDIRGLMPEEYVEGNIWRKNSLTYKIVRYFDKIFFIAADFRVVLSSRIKEIIERGEYIYDFRGKEARIKVIPSCVRLDKFIFNPKGRDYIRDRLGLSGKFVVLYIGSLGTWYMLDKMLDFFVCFRSKKDDAHFLIVTHNGQLQVKQEFAKRGIEDGVSVTSAEPSKMPDYISAGDVGIFFIKPTFSKLSSSPTKFGEFLACGLPVVINAGIGDTADIVAKNRVGVVLQDFSLQSYLTAAADILQMCNDSSMSRRCRDTAREHLSIEIAVNRYKEIYEYLNAN